MLKSSLFGLLFAGILCCHSAQALFLPDQQPTQPQPFALIVKFKTESQPILSKAQSGQIQTNDLAFDELSQRFGASEITPLEKTRRNGPGPLNGVCRLEFSGGEVTQEILQAYRSLPGVEYAEFDYRLSLFELPNDSLFQFQWSLANNGQQCYHVNRLSGTANDVMVMESGTADADIDADDVMSQPPDNTATTIVAIIDTGVDLDHPDLVGNIWQNPGEIAGNGIDDDHNGFVDDVNGWDYSGNEDYLPLYSDSDPTDTFGHGTHCAGIIAAAAENQIGIAGIAPNCRIMALKFWPMLLLSSAAEAIVYATDNGADVINMSFGGPYPSQTLDDAIEYAYANGVILVAASGNSFTEAEFFPAANPLVIAVGATDANDHVTPFSTYGAHLDLCAPGNSILSLRASSTDMYGSESGGEPGVHIVQDLYYEASGTSMAAPHVVGVAAYLRSVSPGLNPAQAAAILTQTADDYLDPYGSGDNLPGWDIFSGSGRVNLRAVLAAAPRLRAIITSPDLHSIVSGTVDVSGTASGEDFADYALEYGLGNSPVAWLSLNQGVTPVVGGTLGQLETAGIDGPITIRLRVGESNVDQVTFFAANQTLAEFVDPGDGDTLLGTTNLTFSAYCPDFDYTVLEFSLDTTPDVWKSIDTCFEPSLDEANAVFNCSVLPNGSYHLRLSVYSSTGLVEGDTIAITVNSLFAQPHGWRVNLSVAPTLTPNYGDFDRDGVNEIVLGTEHGIKFYALDGTERTSGMPVFPDLDFRMPIPVGDLDGDGFDDFAAVSVSPATLYAFSSSGREFSRPVSRVPQNRYFYVSDEFTYPMVFLQDIDADGRDEIYYYSGHSNESATEIFDLYTDDGSPQLQSSFYTGRCLPVDLDGDGLGETCRLSGETVFIYNLQSQQVGTYFLPSGTQVFGMSAVDVDGDNDRELVLSAVPNLWGGDGNIQIFALGDGGVPVAGFPKPTHVNYFWAPSPPVYGDIDGDDVPEVLFTFYTDSYSYAYAYRLDGSSFLGDSTSIGAFAVSPWTSIMRRPFLVNTQGDEGAEVLTLAGRDYAFKNLKAAVLCWDENAKSVPGWPVVLYEGLHVSIEYSTMPVFGDIDKNGQLDLLVSTTQNQLLFANFNSIPFDSANSPCPMWRYNRSYNGAAPLWGGAITDVADGSETTLPSGFALFQNYPNPFNLRTRVDFSLPAATDVSVSVSNTLGQEVAILWQGTLRAGTHQVFWDGRDKTGHEVASGIYLLRLNASTGSQTRKMVLLK